LILQDLPEILAEMAGGGAVAGAETEAAYYNDPVFS
jgi:hypothetical protein